MWYDTVTMDKKILIVEDEPDIREAMAEAIAEAGYQVLTAENGQIGFDKAVTEQPDLILLDIVMPVLDGLSTMKKLRQDPRGRNLKIIMLTSMDDVHNVGAAHEYSITDYLIKPHSSLDDIVKKVKQVLLV
jgi:two-component system alkaline phosphatase synthesis response regulator PhoP